MMADLDSATANGTLTPALVTACNLVKVQSGGTNIWVTSAAAGSLCKVVKSQMVNDHRDADDRNKRTLLQALY